MSDSRTVEAAPRTYDFLCEHHWHDPKTFPTPEVLREAESALGGVEEFMVDPILGGIAAVAIVGPDGALTDEQIGRLVVWADHVNETAQRIAETAQKVSYLARNSYMGSELPFDERGNVTDVGCYRRNAVSLVSFGNGDDA